MTMARQWEHDTHFYQGRCNVTNTNNLKVCCVALRPRHLWDKCQGARGHSSRILLHVEIILLLTVHGADDEAASMIGGRKLASRGAHASWVAKKMINLIEQCIGDFDSIAYLTHHECTTMWCAFTHVTSKIHIQNMDFTHFSLPAGGCPWST